MDIVNTQEMIKVLKDAGIYEDNMPKEDIKNYYNAVVDSRDTSTAENKSRIINDSPEDMFSMDSYTQTSNQSKVETQIEDSDSESNMFKPEIKTYNKKSEDKDVLEDSQDESIPQDATKACFSFDDMPKDNESPLKIIFHPPLYINIQNSESFIRADVSTKAKMLFKYHSKMDKLRSALSRQSFFSAPIPKPIEISTITPSTYDFDIINETEETYVSRAGRQTKRKVYNDDEDLVTLPSNKKTKSKYTEKPKWQSKTKPAPKKAESSQESMDTETTEVQKETPKTFTRSKKPLTPAEIMSRSKLFQDSPPKRTTRTEKLFDKLQQETIKKQKEEKVMEAFDKSLNCDIEANRSESQKEEDPIPLSDDEIPKQVILPVLTKARRPIHSSSQQPKSVNKIPNKRKEKEMFEQVNASTSRADISTNIECPICRKFFSKDSIQEHASGCGEEQMITRNISRPKITCPICDKVIPNNYEVHLSVCKKSRENLDNERE